MRNLKKILALALALVMAMSLMTVANAANFSDSADISYKEAVDVMVGIGVIDGMDDGSFEERAHLSSCGSLDMYEIVKALYEIGFNGPIRPDHGRMIWGEVAMPGYGLYDRALGATYINGLWEAIEKGARS